MHRYARSSLRVHTQATHSVTYMHIYTNAHTRVSTYAHPHTHTRARPHMLSQHREAGLYIYGRETLPMIASNKYGFTWSKHKKIKVTNSRGSHPVIVCKLRQNFPLKSSRTGPRCVKVWHNVKSLSFSLSLLYTDMYNIHGGFCWTDQSLCTSDDEKPLKVDIVKHIRSPKWKDNPFQRQRVCFKHTHIL